MSHTPASLWSVADRTERCRLDAWAAYLIAKEEYPKVDPLLYEFTNRTAFALHRLSLAGAIIDLGRLEGIANNVGSELERVTDRLRKTATVYTVPTSKEQNVYISTVPNVNTSIECKDPKGSLPIDTVFNPDNDNHIRELIYTKLKLPVLSLTSKEKLPQVTRDVLKALLEGLPTEDPKRLILQALIDYSILAKIKSTYVDGLRDLITPVGQLDGNNIGWLPFNFNPLGARTGRPSSSEPNSQNWPDGARKMVRSRWSGGSIIETDYEKIEPIVIAWLAGDEKLLNFFSRGNGYIDVARELFQKEVQSGTPLYRAVKSIVLGVHYDMQTEKMARELWKQGIRFGEWGQHYAITDQIRQSYLTTFSGVARYMEARREEKATTGQVITATGRVRRLSGAGKHADNQAINFPVQSLAFDICASAILDVERALLAEYNLPLVEWYTILTHQRKIYLDRCSETCYTIPTMFNTVHDSLLTDSPPGQEAKTEEILVETMKAIPTFRVLVPSFDVKLRVDVKKGPTWGSK